MTFPQNVQEALVFLKAAQCPEDVFGAQAEIKTVFRELAMLVHEDKSPIEFKALAHDAFILLTKWNDTAGEKIKNGTYGDKKPVVIATIATKTNTYNLFSLISEGDIADFYLAKNRDNKTVLLKICRSFKNNDLMKNEADILAKLPAELDPKFAGYFPNLLDSFEINKPRQRINVFEYSEGAVTIEQVRQAYPDGINPADAAWMWNRCLEAVHLLHTCGYVHTSVTPSSFIIVPSTHQGMLIDFCYAVKVGEKAKAIIPQWKAMYPPEIFSKNPVDFSTDIFNTAHLLEFLIQPNIPKEVNNILKGCKLGKAFRPNSAHEVYLDIKKVWFKLYGPKKFREFKMPSGI